MLKLTYLSKMVSTRWKGLLPSLRCIVCLLVVLANCPVLVRAQSNITRVEYYIDIDPGFGNAAALSVSSAADISNANIAINPATLAEGVHRLYVRAQNANGQWSMTNTWLFYKPYAGTGTLPAPVTYNITKVEYYIDTDPGYGNATPLNITPGTNIQDAVIPVNPAPLVEGVHRLYVRAQNESGTWSMVNTLLFYKPYSGTSIPALPPVPDITRIEYYIDTDPGAGNATPLPASPGTDLQDLVIAINPADIGNGVHRLYVRSQNATGGWSMVNNWLFYKPYGASGVPILAPPANITRIEYYVDNDPGPGQATAMTITPGTQFQDLVISIDPAAVREGVHRLYVRAQDANNAWSMVNTWLFYKPYGTDGIPTVTPPSNLVYIEYYVDTDPGVGKGTAVAFSPGTNIADLVVPVNINALTYASHILYLRARDANGNWSLVNKLPFQRQSPSALYATVGDLPDTICAGSTLQIPFTVNAPFTAGNIFKAQLSNSAGSFVTPTDLGSLTGTTAGVFTVTVPADLAAGAGYVIRIVSTNPVDTSNISDPLTVSRAPQQNFTISGKTDVCLGVASYSADFLEQGLSWQWSLSDGGVLQPSGSNADITWNTPGAHTITLTGINTCGTKTSTVLVRVHGGPPSSTPVITVNGNILTARAITPADSATAYQWYLNNAAVSGATNGTFTPAADGNYTVSYTNSCGAGPASGPYVFVTNKQDQTITFPPLPDLNFGTDMYAVLKATSSASLPVTYSIVSGPATIRQDTLVITGAGTIVVQIFQAGNSSYNSVTTNVTIVVNKRPATITLTNLTQTYNGSPKIPVVTTDPPGLPVTLTYNGSSNGPVDPGTYQVIAVINSADYTGADTASFVIQPLQATDLAVQNVRSNTATPAPGDSVIVSWNVANIGTAPSPIKWTERLSIQSVDGSNRTFIQQNAFTSAGVLNAGAALSRSLGILLPGQINIGDQGVFVVEIQPDTSVHETSGGLSNNIGIQQTPVTIRKVLMLALSASQVTEGAADGFAATLTRTGSLSQSLTVAISNDQSGRLSFPASVTIPPGQSGSTFIVTATNNTAIEGPINDTLRAAASGFVSARAGLTILDDDKPSLSVTNLPATAVEGSTVTFKVTTDLAPATPLTVFLISSSPTRFPVPASVTIPAGALSVDVPVVLQQDTVPEVAVTVNIGASAANYNSASAAIQVNDDDLPGLELVLQTNLIPEGAGPYATQATLRRIPNTNNSAFTANLSASLPNTLILPAQVAMAAGQNEISFTVGVIDNGLADGDRPVSITAALIVNSCGCTAPPASAGSVSASLTVTDNDGPALLLTASQLTFPEGLSNAGPIRITRNTPATGSLQVTLTSSNTNEATVPATVTIPAGQTFVDVPVTTINDNVTDGSQQVYFQASAEGFSTGSIWFIISDLNKPDLQLPAVLLNSSAVQAMATFNYQLSVKNTGAATAPTGVKIYGYLSKDETIDNTDTLIIREVTTVPIPAGQTIQLPDAVKAPNLPGNYKLLFLVNPDNSLAELLTSNNTSAPVAFAINPDYTATAQVDPAYFTRGSVIPVTGAATRSDASPAANVPVEVYIITNGLRRTVTATTNASGQYTAQFIPLTSEAGHYIVGASFPGIGATAEQDHFEILGVRINNGQLPQFKVTLNDTLKGTLTVENLSKQTLSNFSLAPLTLPGGANIRFDTAAQLPGNATVNLGYAVSGTVLTSGNYYQAGTLQAKSNEGNIQPNDIFYFCQSAQAYIQASITAINAKASSSAGQQEVQFTLVNKGAGATGAITIGLPKVGWISNLTPLVLPSLATGDSTIVVLKFLATADVPFDFPVTGNIAIGAQNGNNFVLPFSFEKVSVTTGIAKITVTDQYTYLTQGAPNVAGAHVVIKNYFSGEVYAEGLTDASGVFTASGIPEGKHRVDVDKDKHLPYDGTITMNPGDTAAATVFINYQAITFTWDVVPTTVQDKYDITLTTHYETDVPMPVVTIDMPKTFPQLSGADVYPFNVTLTNHGLITAQKVALTLPQGDAEYEFVTNYVTSDLGAQQSIQVPVIMRRRGVVVTSTSGKMSIKGFSKFLNIAAPQFFDGGGCTVFTTIIYSYVCSLSTGLWVQNGASTTFEGRSCDGPAPEPPTGGGEVPYTGNGVYFDAPCVSCGGGGVGTAATPTYTQNKTSCDACIVKVITTVDDCPKLGGGDVSTDMPTAEDPGVQCLKTTIVTIGDCSADPSNDAVASRRSTVGIQANASGNQVTGGKQVADARQVAGGKVVTDGKQVTGDKVATGDLGSVFTQIADDWQTAVNAWDASGHWATEYFGDLINYQAWKDLKTMLAPFVSKLDSIPATAQATILASMKGYDVPASSLQAFFVRWNTSLYAKTQGVMEPNAQYPGIINWTKKQQWADSITQATNAAINEGYTSVYDMYSKQYDNLNTILEQQSKDAVCASVTVQFSQQLTMTREAFQGTLGIFNGHPSIAMDSLSVNIQITDENGVPANDLFEIQTKSVDNLTNVTGTGSLNAQQNGTAVFLFIPEIAAAPTTPKVYSFGGTVKYLDPYGHGMVTMPLSPVKLTVNPSPNLMLHYFMQRNILGDDPLTSPQIEPSVPAELAVMIDNYGYGPAVNMLLSSAQPKVVDNEKGLAINFQLIGSNLQGQPKNLGVTDINFGTLPALQARIGEWYLTSSLLGKFVSYDAQVVHDNSFGNPDLSLIKGVKLHELTHSIKVYGADDDGINDFLVNDIFDANDVPDIIYFSQGKRTSTVYPATSGSFSAPVAGPTFTNTLTVTASDTGWNYIQLSDPGNGLYELASVTRSDGQVIPLDNAWLTFVTLPVSRAPVYENKFHFVDSFPAAVPATYTVVWKPKNTDVPVIKQINGAPSEVSTVQVGQLTVVFNKAIDPATFTWEDLTLTFQGGPNIINNSVKVTRVDSVTFLVDLSALTTGNGFYAFTAQAADIKDIYGTNGTSGKQVTWTQFLTVPTVQAFLAIPDSRKARAYDTIQVLFNLPIDVTTVTPASFIIKKDSVVVSGSVRIDSVRADHKLFYLSGLGNILKTSGVYEFIVDLPNIRSADNIAGIQTQSVLLTLDNTGPVIVNMAQSDSGGLDAQHVAFVHIDFDEEVRGFNTAAVRLTWNGQTIPLDITQLSNTDLAHWTAGNFGMLTYPGGDYTFAVDLSAITDAAGNPGVGTKQITWKVDRSSGINISNLDISPDKGYSSTDGITANQSMTVTFHLSQNAKQVAVAQTDASGDLVLVNLPDVNAGDVSVPVGLPKAGNTGIKIIATGENSGIATAVKTLYVDNIPLAVQWLFTDGQQIARQPDSIQLAFTAKLLDNTGLISGVQFKKDGVVLPAGSLSIQALNDTLYQVSGLRGAGILPGMYQISFDPQSYSKYTSGGNGQTPVTVSWTLASSNRAPVANAGIDITVTTPGTFSLDGSASGDPDGDPFTYSWIAPEGLTLTDTASAKPSFAVTTADQGKTYSILLIVSDGNLFTTDVVNVTVAAPSTGLMLSARAFLQGPYVAAAGLMADSLRAKALIPASDPYPALGFIPTAAGQPLTVSTAVLNATGNAAIVDWIWLELRNPTDPDHTVNQVVAARSALIRRDGNIVDMDGVSPVRFDNIPAGNYFIALRHRNHLGIMTGVALPLSSTAATTVDFTASATATYGTNAQYNGNGVMLMWAGDVNGDGRVTYNGDGSDKDAIRTKVGVGNPNNVLFIYDRADVNMDGKVKFNGAVNDKNIILGILGLHTPDRIITQQLPQ